MSKVEISIGRSGYQSKVVVDGHDISNVVRRVTLDVEAGDLPAVVSLELVPEAIEVDAEAKVFVSGLLRGGDTQE